MSKENTTSPTPETPKRRGGLKMILIVAIVMAIEGAAIVGTMYFTGDPKSAQGQGMGEGMVTEMNKPVEIPFLEQKFLNSSMGKAYFYDTSIYVKTRKKHETQVSDIIEASKASLTEKIGVIFSEADASMLSESTRATLKRQIKALLDERFGKDAEGNPMIEEVVIPTCMMYPAD